MYSLPPRRVCVPHLSGARLFFMATDKTKKGTSPLPHIKVGMRIRRKGSDKLWRVVRVRSDIGKITLELVGATVERDSRYVKNNYTLAKDFEIDSEIVCPYCGGSKLHTA